jgi:hypothetical protein
MEAMKEVDEVLGVQVVALLVVVAFASAFVLWTIDTSLSSGESLFAIYLSIDLIAFTMISYIYRVTKAGDPLRRIPLVVGSCLMLVLVLAGFAA